MIFATSILRPPARISALAWTSLAAVLAGALTSGCAKGSGEHQPSVHAPTPCRAAGEDPDGPRVWDSQRACWLTVAALRARLSTAPIILLGEQHDHPTHHQLQAQVLRWLVDANRRPAVVFEMLDTSQQPLLDAARSSEAETPGARADALAVDVDWASSGWPPWPLYRPIFVEAFRHDLPLTAGGLPRPVVQGAMREGAKALPAMLVRRHGLDAPWPTELQEALIAELDAAHCGLLPEAMHAPMALVQRARDAQMAESLQRHADGAGAVLIAGAGHVRRDRGVPWYLRRQGLDALSVGFVSTTNKMAPEPSTAAGARYDLVWWTERVANEKDDPCADLR